MLKMRHIAISSALLFGAACTPALDVTKQPVDVRFTSTANQPTLTGYHPTFVRSYVANSGSSKSETAGVVCEVRGSGYDATVQTPGIVNLPVFGAGSRATTFTCTDGEKSVVEQSLPYNVTSDQRIASGANGGLIGVLVMAGVDAASDKSNDTWGYRNVEVSFAR